MIVLLEKKVGIIFLVFFQFSKIKFQNNDQKSLFDINKKLLVNQHAATLPTHESNFELANRFRIFFNDKIDTLRTSFRIYTNSDVGMEPLPSVKLNNLISATSDQICDVIASCPNNLHFISKVIENLVAKRLEEHMSEYSMYDPMKSAYKLVQLTETALGKLNSTYLAALMPESVLFLYPFPQPSILLITT